MYGSTKTIFRIKDDSFKPDLTNSEKKSIDHIIGVSSKKYWDNFIKLVYSTHPIASSERYSYLNLGEKAAEYQELRDAQYLTPPPSPSKPPHFFPLKASFDGDNTSLLLDYCVSLLHARGL